MTKIILPNILWCILFPTLLNLSNGLMNYDENSLRKFPYVMSPTPFISRQTRDVQDVLNLMAKGDDGNHLTTEIQKSSIENQIQDQHSQHNIRNEHLLPPQSHYQYASPQMYGQQNSFQQQSQNIIRQTLESETVHHHHNHQEQNQQNSQQQEPQQIQNTLKWSQPDLTLQSQIQQQIHQHVQQQIQEQQLQQHQFQQLQQQQLQQLQQQQLQQQQLQQHQLQQQHHQQQSFQQQQQQQPTQQQLPLYTVPPQIHNQIQSIYQNQQPIPSQNSIAYSYNQNHMSAPYPPKMEVVQPSLAYLPSTLQPPTVTSTSPPPTPTPLVPTTQTPTTPPPPPPPMVNITPKPRISKTYIPVMPPTSPKPTKAVITNIYSYDSPTDSDEDATAEEPEVPARQHYKILFIRAPNQISKNTIRRAHAQHQNQHKTVVYILSKKTDVSEIRDALQYLPTTTTKPEVHFIRYKTEDEAEHAKHQIQHHYHQLSDSTQYSNEGIPLITSAIGILPRNEADTPNNGYLPPIQHTNESGYLPPPLPSSQSSESTANAEYLPPSK